MVRVAPHIPADNDLLCETCGYILNGLPQESRCPECGQPIVESLPETRCLAPIEEGKGGFKTSVQVLFAPKRFYRHLATRHTTDTQWHFAAINWLLSSILLALSVFMHINGIYYGTHINIIETLFLVIGIYILTVGTNFLAALLSAWEAKYRGMRLSYAVVIRGLCFHSIHYLPVALMVTLTITIYNFLIACNFTIAKADTYYLYTLCVEVFIGAGYLFWTYWIAMRNMMYANR